MSGNNDPLSPEQEMEILKSKAYRIVKRWRGLTLEQQLRLVNEACAEPLNAPLWDDQALTKELFERLTNLRGRLPRPKRDRKQKGRVILEYVGGARPKDSSRPTTEYILEKKASQVQLSTEYRPAIEHTSWRRRELERAGDLVHSILEAVQLVSPEDREVLDDFLNVVLPNDTINAVAEKLGIDRTTLRRVLDRAREIADYKIFAKKGHAVATTQPVLIDKLVESALDDFPPTVRLFLPLPNASTQSKEWSALAAQNDIKWPVANSMSLGKRLGQVQVALKEQFEVDISRDTHVKQNRYRFWPKTEGQSDTTPPPTADVGESGQAAERGPAGVGTAPSAEASLQKSSPKPFEEVVMDLYPKR